MLPSHNIYIHLGLHKTGSTYLQRSVFPHNAERLNFFSIRRKKQLSDFGRYILRENDITYKAQKAFELLTRDKLFEINDNLRLLLSDEQFAGAPWNSAKDRKRNFDRLHELFPKASYILVLRDQEVLTQSLYLEYIKKGGTAHWKDFLTHRGNDLDFSRGDYLRFAEYYQYMVSLVGADRIQILYYEALQEDPKTFFNKMGAFLNVDIVIPPKNETKNPSIGGTNARWLRFFNRFLRSPRQPFLLGSGRVWYAMQKFLMRRKTSKKFIIPKKVVTDFCETYKKSNLHLPEPDALKKYGYINDEV